MELEGYGAGQSGLVLVEKSGPVDPDPEHVRIAHAVAKNQLGGPFPPPYMDCGPNIVLKDYVCEDCGNWHWGMVVAHDATCPTNEGLTAPPR